MQENVINWISPRASSEARSRQFLMLVEGTADAAFAVNSSGRISAWNKAAAELFGRSEAEMMSVRCHELLHCSDEDAMICSEHCVVKDAAQANCPVASLDLRIKTKAGWLWCNVSTLIASEALTGNRQAIHIVRSIEGRKRLEQALNEVVRLHVENCSNGKPLICQAANVNVSLTSRELEVLKSLAKGHTTRAIANQFNISSATVKNHIKHILTKFDVHTRLEAIRHAESVGVI
ncbi:MAG TPA: LuxR C-terminal-related transcriptional regulator [Pyrinomonadaceae bacterium]|nr:LuxR C-terminal-related transcriptional regulator [Pyrinomonadaceae bacterium]